MVAFVFRKEIGAVDSLYQEPLAMLTVTIILCSRARARDRRFDQHDRSSSESAMSNFVPFAPHPITDGTFNAKQSVSRINIHIKFARSQ